MQTKQNLLTRSIPNIDKTFGKLDIFIDNAGICTEQIFGKENSSSVTLKDLQQTFQTNLFSVVKLTQKMLPLIKKSPAGQVVNLSSILASLTLHSMRNSPIDPAKAFAYNASKTVVNEYTIHLRMNSVTPISK